MGTVKYTGPVASFHCPTNAEIRSLKVHFSPKQEGSGNPSPDNVREIVGWDGVKVQQSRRNLFDANNVTYVSSDAWCNNSTHKIVASNGDKTLYIPCLANSVYTISKTIGDVLAGGYTNDIPTTGMDLYSYYRDTGARKITITTGDDAKYLAIWFYDKSKSSDKTMTPEDVYRTLQIEYGTTATSYEPYQGSTTNYEFGVLGKNKLDPSLCELEKYWGSSGNKSSTSNWIAVNYIKVVPGQTYTVTGSTVTTESPTAQHLFYNSDKQLVSNIPAGVTNQTFTVPNECEYVRLSIKATSVDGLQLELGSTATTYEPYDPKHTVYGGWVDLISGEVCEIHSLKTFNGSEQQWLWSQSSNGIPYITIDSMKSGTWYTDTSTICDTAVKVNVSSSGALQCLIGYNNNRIYFYNATSVISDVTDLNSFTNWLSTNNMSITYPLETPLTYYLAPVQLQTFLGQNNVWSNADYVEVEYDLHETQDILARKQFIIANQPHIVTSEPAALQCFSTDVAAPLKECKIHFSPVQEGEGDPSPDNIRPISGWNGITIDLSGRNLIRSDAEWSSFKCRPSSGVLIGSSYNTAVIPVPQGIIRIHQGHVSGGYINYACLADKFPEQGDIVYEGVSKSGWTNYTLDNSAGHPYLLLHGPTTSNPLPPAQWCVANENYVLLGDYNDDDYTPTNGVTIPLGWIENGTIYGGYVDFIKGELVQEWKKINISDLNWNNYSSKIHYYAWLPVDEREAKSVIYSNLLTPRIDGGFAHEVTGEFTYYGVSSNTTSYKNNIWTKLPEAMEYTDANNWIKANYAEAYLVYKLQTPIHYPLSTPQLQTLRGTNNIWSNANGPIDIKYWTH